MKIDTYKIRVAHKVLKAIRAKLSKVSAGDNHLHLEHYQNGREQGYLVVNYPTPSLKMVTKWVAFSENRNSDNIVVYPGQNWHIPSSSIDDESFDHRVYFGPAEANKAASFCVQYLLGK